MTNRCMLGKRHGFGFAQTSGNKIGRISVVICFVLTIGIAQADDIVTHHDDVNHGRFCSETALVLFKACRSEITNDFLVAKANCMNISSKEERDTCFAVARKTLNGQAGLCREQFTGRKD